VRDESYIVPVTHVIRSGDGRHHERDPRQRGQHRGIKSAKQLVGSLSGGQAQAVAIARAVHFKRSLLILDEPTSALAVRATEALLNYLVQLKGEGVSSVLVTQNLHHAFKVCDRHIVMNHRRKILEVRREDTSVEELTGRSSRAPRASSGTARASRWPSSTIRNLTATMKG
jgi:ABC-type sugar transport system ATPase subunit